MEGIPLPLRIFRSERFRFEEDAFCCFRLGSRKRRSRQSTAEGLEWNRNGRIPFQWQGFRFRGWKMPLPLEDVAVTRPQEDSSVSTMIPKPTEAYKPVGKPPEAYSRRRKSYGVYMEGDPGSKRFERFQSSIPLARLV
jgi:hypothetical protein